MSPSKVMMLAVSLLLLTTLACSAIVHEVPQPSPTMTAAAGRMDVPFTPTATQPIAKATATVSEVTVSLGEAVDQGLVEIEILGSGMASGSSVFLTLRRLVPSFVRVDVAPGTVLISSVPGEQDMVVRRLLGLRLDSQHYQPAEQVTIPAFVEGPQEYVLEAYCLNFHKDNPSVTTTFSLGGLADADVLAVLEAMARVPGASEDIVAIQAAVWAVSDDTSWTQLAERGYQPDQARVRAILEASGIDLEGRQVFAPVREPAVTDVSQPVVEGTDTPSAPLGRWESLSDLPRYVNALVADPDDPQVLYAGTGFTGSGAGVYKSEDAGLTWQLASTGLPSEDANALAFSRQSPPTLFAVVGNAVWASVDGGASWSQRAQGVGNWRGFERLSVASDDGQVLYGVAVIEGAFRSDDGGYNWRPVNQGLPKDQDALNVQSLAVHPDDADQVYLGTGWRPFHGNGVYKSVDGGSAWTAANRGMIDYSITALAIDAMDPQAIYAGTFDGELFKSLDGGATWEDLSADLPVQGTVLAVVIDPARTETVYLLCERVGVLVSEDGGGTWRLLGKPAELDYPSFTALVVTMAPQPVVVIGVKDEGGWRYTVD